MCRFKKQAVLEWMLLNCLQSTSLTSPTTEQMPGEQRYRRSLLYSMPGKTADTHRKSDQEMNSSLCTLPWLLRMLSGKLKKKKKNLLFFYSCIIWGGSVVKNLPAMQEMQFDPWVGKMPWRKARQPTPVFLPGESHRQRSLAGSGPWGCKESDMTEATWA